MTGGLETKRENKNGGSELARDSALPDPVRLNVPPSSRASSLPKGAVAGMRFVNSTSKNRKLLNRPDRSPRSEWFFS